MCTWVNNALVAKQKIIFFSLFVSLSLMCAEVYAGTWTSGSTTITTSGSTLTVSGNGQMADYGYEGNRAWVSNSITEITIEEGVTHIGANAFISAQYVTRVDIPTSVTSIGEGAFGVCSRIAGIYYAGSPNEWASITFTDDASNPFTDANQASNHYFYFYGSTTATTVLTLTPGITNVNAYAFNNATITDINIPGSVSNIGAYAFRCGVSGTVCVNRATPPTTAGKNTITYGSNAKLYVPSGSKTTYVNNGMPWKYNSGTYGLSNANIVEQAVSGNTLGTYGANVKWNLGEDGVLTLDASGASAAKDITIDAASTTKMPWYYFRRLVHKLKIKGEITALNNTLHYHYGISEIILDQETIPTISPTYIATSGSSPYTALFNPRDPLTLRVKLSAILSPSESAKLETAPWNDGKWQIAVSDDVVINDNDDDSDDILEAIKEKVHVPFTMQLGRSLSSAYYNTFCSPIPLNATDICASGADIRELVNTAFDESENTLALNFSTPLSAIEAGKPYIIKPNANVANPVFDNVAPDDIVSDADNDFIIPGTPSSYITAHGILAPYTPQDSEYGKNFLFLMADNKLTWATSGTLKGMRAFFKLSPSAPAHLPQARTIMRMPNVATGVDDIYVSQEEDNVINNSNIRKTFCNGQLLIIRDGRTYNAQGTLIQ